MGRKRSIAVFTSTRADYGLWTWILRAIQEHPSLTLRLIVGGTHLSEEHGRTIRFIEQDGIEIAGLANYLSPGSTAYDVVSSAGRAVGLFGEVLHTIRPEMVLLLGDRYETLCAAFAAISLGLPVGHIHGGEVTEGAVDESYRHAITKLSHVHFAASHDAARRIVQLGEDPDRVHVCGAPGIETLIRTPAMSPAQLSDVVGLALDPGFLLVTYHPETLSPATPNDQIAQVTAALTALDLPTVITGPNADAGGGVIARELDAWCRQSPRAVYVTSARQEVYINLMRHAGAMVGNSSSGIIEAPSIPLPVVNIGDRQRGRQRGENVIDVPCLQDAIVAGISRALSPAFREHLAGKINPYGDGRTSPRIVEVLANLNIGSRLLQKEFHDLRAFQRATV